MNKASGFFLIGLCCFWLACKKTDSQIAVAVQPPVTGDTSRPPVSNPDLITADQFELFSRVGATFKFKRYDTLRLDIRNPKYNFGVRWVGNRKPDDSTFLKYNNVVYAILIVYRDSSIENITVSGKTDYGTIKKIIPVQNYSSLRYRFLLDSLHLSDTATFAVWTISNPAHQTVDTAYVYAAANYFAIIPTYTSSQSAEAIGFSSIVPIPKGDPHISPYGYCSYSTKDTLLFFGGASYPGGNYIRRFNEYHSGNGFYSEHDQLELYFSRTSGLIHQYHYEDSYANMYGANEYVVVRNIYK